MLEELAHESLGHPKSQLIQRGGLVIRTCAHDVEDEAYSVAAALLMPYRDLFNHLNASRPLANLSVPAPVSDEGRLPRVNAPGFGNFTSPGNAKPRRWPSGRRRHARAPCRTRRDAARLRSTAQLVICCDVRYGLVNQRWRAVTTGLRARPAARYTESAPTQGSELPMRRILCLWLPPHRRIVYPYG